MADYQILAKGKRGPGSFTSANITVPPGKTIKLKITTDIPVTDLLNTAMEMNLFVERYNVNHWEIILGHTFKGPWSKPGLPSPIISATWTVPETSPAWTVRATASLATRMTLGLVGTVEVV